MWGDTKWEFSDKAWEQVCICPVRLLANVCRHDANGEKWQRRWRRGQIKAWDMKGKMKRDKKVEQGTQLCARLWLEGCSCIFLSVAYTDWWWASRSDWMQPWFYQWDINLLSEYKCIFVLLLFIAYNNAWQNQYWSRGRLSETKVMGSIPGTCSGHVKRVPEQNVHIDCSYIKMLKRIF